ncbi:hypothetical protein A2U01_0074186, partial [Trifolium medium]|nr:hypothetical protein [Trifolium medium]
AVGGCLVSGCGGMACRLTTLFEDGEDNGKLPESGCCR